MTIDSCGGQRYLLPQTAKFLYISKRKKRDTFEKQMH